MEQPQTGETVSASCRKEDDILPDQVFFTVDADAFARFQAMADRPLPPSDRLRRLLKTKAHWDR